MRNSDWFSSVRPLVEMLIALSLDATFLGVQPPFFWQQNKNVVLVLLPEERGLDPQKRRIYICKKVVNYFTIYQITSGMERQVNGVSYPAKIQNLEQLPIDACLRIFKFLPYHEVATRVRPVSRRMSMLAGKHLNSGFDKVEQFTIYLFGKLPKLPNRDSLRERHVCFAHHEMLDRIKTRLNYLRNVVFYRYLAENLCCFFAGKVLDELIPTLRRAKKLFKEGKSIEDWQEEIKEFLALSDMAKNHMASSVVPKIRDLESRRKRMERQDRIFSWNEKKNAVIEHSHKLINGELPSDTKPENPETSPALQKPIIEKEPTLSDLQNDLKKTKQRLEITEDAWIKINEEMKTLKQQVAEINLYMKIVLEENRKLKEESKGSGTLGVKSKSIIKPKTVEPFVPSTKMEESFEVDDACVREVVEFLLEQIAG